MHRIELEIQNEELRRSQIELAKTSNRFSLLFDKAPVGYVVLDEKAMILEVNGTFLEMAGWRGPRPVGKPFFDFIAPAALPVFLARFKALFKKPEGKKIETELKTRDAAGLPVMLEAALYEGDIEEKRQTQLFVSLSDISARKKAEQALVESERFATATLNGLSSQIAIVDATGTILAVNAAWRSQAELNSCLPARVGEGVNYLEAFRAVSGADDKTADALIDGVRAVLSGRVPGFTLEYPCHSSTEKRWFCARVTLFPGSGPPRIVVAHEDITERTLAAEAMDKARQAAEDANLAKSVFLANMSHEIRTPLNGVIGMLQLLELESLLPDQAEFVLMAKESAERLLGLLNDILDISRIDAGKMKLSPEPFHPRELIAEAVGMFTLTAKGKGVPLTSEIADNVPHIVRGDQARLMQILFNLIGNAVKFTSEGEVAVRLAALPRKYDSEVQPLLFTITDSGPGIADEVLPRLFHPFAQADSSFTKQYQGAGLGLSIVKRLVALLGGSICLDSLEGQGTSIYFTIEVETEPSLTGDAGEADDLPEPDRSLRILLADDDKISLVFAKTILEKSGHLVRCLHHGGEVLEALARERFDLVVMDVQMPVLSGLDASKAIRAANEPFADIPIVAMSAYAMEGDRERFLEAGMTGYVSKPVNARALREAIDAAVNPVKSAG